MFDPTLPPFLLAHIMTDDETPLDNGDKILIVVIGSIAAVAVLSIILRAVVL